MRLVEGPAVFFPSIFDIGRHQRRGLHGFPAEQSGNGQNRHDVGQRAGVAAACSSRKTAATTAARRTRQTPSPPRWPSMGFQRPKMTIPSAINPCPETMDSRKGPPAQAPDNRPPFPPSRPNQHPDVAHAGNGNSSGIGRTGFSPEARRARPKVVRNKTNVRQRTSAIVK